MSSRSMSDLRAEICAMMSEIMGFDFREQELPPKLRKEIGDLAETLDYYYLLIHDLNAAKTEYEDTRVRFALLFFGSVIGIIMVIVFPFFSPQMPGILKSLSTKPVETIVILVVLFFATFISFVKMRTPPNETIKEKEKDATSCWSDINNQVKKLAEETYNELSTLYEAKVTPTVKQLVIDFARIIQAAKGRGIILDTIECPYCKAAVRIPTSGEYFECKYCGKVIHATKIFDKLKDILYPT